jgi:GDP-L-fucose synthase
VGYGSDVTIRELAEAISEAVGFKGSFAYEAEKPDGTPQKLLDCSRLNSLGWRASTGLRDGIAKTYEWYLQNKARK